MTPNKRTTKGLGTEAYARGTISLDALTRVHSARSLGAIWALKGVGSVERAHKCHCTASATNTVVRQTDDGLRASKAPWFRNGVQGQHEASFSGKDFSPPPLDISSFIGFLTGRPQKRLDRRLEEVAKAVGGGYCR